MTTFIENNSQLTESYHSSQALQFIPELHSFPNTGPDKRSAGIRDLESSIVIEAPC